MTLSDSFLRWRVERTTVAELECKPVFHLESPLSDSFEEWRILKGKLQPGDELWTFCSPQELWDRRMGWQGILLLREGQVVEVCITAQN